MGARFDHLVVAVEDLDEAAARWRAAGIPAERGGAHPVGTENVLVRGPAPAYVELIAAGSDESNPWLDRVRSARGPISWAVAVDDLDEARTALEAAGFEPDPPVPGSRRTPDGELLEWRVCDVGPGPYDGSLPFLIEWTTPMAPGSRGSQLANLSSSCSSRRAPTPPLGDSSPNAVPASITSASPSTTSTLRSRAVVPPASDSSTKPLGLARNRNHR